VYEYRTSLEQYTENNGDCNEHLSCPDNMVVGVYQTFKNSAKSVKCVIFFLQSHGVFAEGIAGGVKRRFGGGGGGLGGGERDSASNFIPKPKLNLQVNSMECRSYYYLFYTFSKHIFLQYWINVYKT